MKFRSHADKVEANPELMAERKRIIAESFERPSRPAMAVGFLLGMLSGFIGIYFALFGDPDLAMACIMLCAAAILSMWWVSRHPRFKVRVAQGESASSKPPRP